MRSPRPTRWIRWGRGRERREMMGEEGGEGRTPKLWLLRPWWFRPGSDFVFIFSLACEKVSLTFSLTLAYRSNHCIIGLPNISLSLRQIWLVFASKKCRSLNLAVTPRPTAICRFSVTRCATELAVPYRQHPDLLYVKYVTAHWPWSWLSPTYPLGYSATRLVRYRNL